MSAVSGLTGDHDCLGVAVLEEGDVPAGDEAGVQPRGRHGGRPQLQPARGLRRDVVTLRRNESDKLYRKLIKHKPNWTQGEWEPEIWRK